MNSTIAAGISIADAVLSLAFIGDLSMGRPIDHSSRTAWLAARLASADGCSAADCRVAHDVALLRWSGCTANAEGFDDLLGDDVVGRERLMAMTLLVDAEQAAAIVPLAEIHCEVSGDIAQQLGMDAEVEAGLRNIFETWDGRGNPGQRRGFEVPRAVYHVALASDLEILSRQRGLKSALAAITRLGDSKYPAALVGHLVREAPAWLHALGEGAAELQTTLPAADVSQDARAVPLELIADVADLKLPWLAGQSRHVAECAAATGSLLGLDAAARNLLRRAGLVHAMGRAAVPNHVWQRAGRLSQADREQIRLMPYWTYRAAARIPGLRAEAELASHAYERMDGSGHYRNLSGPGLSTQQRVIATAVALVAVRSARPWRPPYTVDQAAGLLMDNVRSGQFDGQVVEAAIAAMSGETARAPSRAAGVLSEREREVLRRISLGESNKEVARFLDISPSTVRTHMESVFRKLDCSTRAAATLKAFAGGLI